MSTDSSDPKTFASHAKNKLEKDRGQRPDFGGPLRVVASLAFIFLFSQVVAYMAVSFGLAALAGESEPPAINQTAAGQFVFILIAEIIAVGMVYLTLRRRQLGWGSIGIARRPKWSDAGMALLGFLIFYAAVIVVTVLARQLPGVNLDQPQDIGFDSLISPLDQLLALVSLVILASIGEEILVRGYLYSGLRSRLRVVPAAVLTSVIFGVAHLQPGNGLLVWAAALNTFVLSLILVYLRERTGALYAGMALHSLNNLLAFFVYFYALAF